MTVAEETAPAEPGTEAAARPEARTVAALTPTPAA